MIMRIITSIKILILSLSSTNITNILNTRQSKVPNKELKLIARKMTKKLYRTKKNTRTMSKNMN